MSYKFTFADNAVYTSTDVNNITKRLVTSGVEDCFSDDVAYNVSKFNDIGKLIYTKGTVPESFSSLRVEKVSDTEILINPGTAFFSDGAVIEIEAGGETLTTTPGCKNFVYLKNDLAEKNICYPVCSESKPTGDYVLLAEIDENGEVVDKRTFAKGKVPGYQSVAGEPLFFKETVKAVLTDSCNGNGHAEFDIGNNSYKYIICTNLLTDEGKAENLSIYRIEDGSAASFHVAGKYQEIQLDKSGAIHLYTETKSPYIGHKATLSFEDGILKVDVEVYCSSDWGSDLGDAGDEVDVALNLIFV